MLFDFKKCPVCGNYQRKFLLTGIDSPAAKKYEIIGAGKRYAICSKCGSSDRDRLVFLYLRDYKKIFASHEQIRLLHIAPEKSLSKKIMNNSNIDYVLGDNFEEGYSYDVNVRKMDLRSLPFKENFFDVVVCNHVLEHIEEDTLAMLEIFRVLKLNGTAVLQVPISKIIKETIEDFSITDKSKRYELYGQEDHVRLYGADYVDRLENCGFSVEKINISNLEKYKKCGLNNHEELYVGKKNGR